MSVTYHEGDHAKSNVLLPDATLLVDMLNSRLKQWQIPDSINYNAILLAHTTIGQ